MERKKILLIFLIIIFILVWGWQLKPKKKKINKNILEETIVEKEIIGGIDLKKIEENYSEIKKKITEFENNINSKKEKVVISKNPLKAWIVKKEYKKEEEIEVKKQPDFKVSGIVYDKKRPYVIIDGEVKEEGDEISGFIIQKIYSEKIVLKDKYGNFFTLNFEYEKGGK